MSVLKRRCSCNVHSQGTLLTIVYFKKRIIYKENCAHLNDPFFFKLFSILAFIKLVTMLQFFIPTPVE